MKTQLISSMASFVLGTGATLWGLSTWLGTTDLESIKSLVENHMTDTEQQVSLLAQDYTVTVENANAEISEYQSALEQANDNISQLIVAYQQAEEQHQQELEQAQASAEQDLADLEQALADMQTRLDSQYETDMNAIIIEANRQIDNANYEVGETKRYIEEDLLPTSQIDEIIASTEGYEVNTGGDKSVQDISSVVPSEQE